MTQPAIYQEGGIYDNFLYGSPIVSVGIRAAIVTSQKQLDKDAKVLCVGCGNGYEVVHLLINGIVAYGTELRPITDVPILKGRIIVASSPGLPFRDKEFDIAISCEVLEHLSPKTTIPFIKGVMRVCKRGLFTVDLVDDDFGTHTNLKTPEKWVEILRELPFELLHLQINPIFPIKLTDRMIVEHRFRNKVMFILENSNSKSQ